MGFTPTQTRRFLMDFIQDKTSQLIFGLHLSNSSQISCGLHMQYSSQFSNRFHLGAGFTSDFRISLVIWLTCFFGLRFNLVRTAIVVFSLVMAYKYLTDFIYIMVFN